MGFKRSREEDPSVDKLTEKKHDGGMGFKDLRCYNLAMLAKQGWSLMNGGDSAA